MYLVEGDGGYGRVGMNGGRYPGAGSRACVHRVTPVTIRAFSQKPQMLTLQSGSAWFSPRGNRSYYNTHTYIYLHSYAGYAL